jgi:hypothetical protein
VSRASIFTRLAASSIWYVVGNVADGAFKSRESPPRCAFLFNPHNSHLALVDEDARIGGGFDPSVVLMPGGAHGFEGYLRNCATADDFDAFIRLRVFVGL